MNFVTSVTTCINDDLDYMLWVDFDWEIRDLTERLSPTYKGVSRNKTGTEFKVNQTQEQEISRVVSCHSES